MTNLKAELPGYGTVWFDPQAMTNVLSFSNIAKQYPIQYLQEFDTFQVQLSNRLIIYMFWKALNLKKNLQNLLHPKKMFPKYKQHHMSKLLRRTPSYSLPRRYLSGCG